VKKHRAQEARVDTARATTTAEPLSTSANIILCHWLDGQDAARSNTTVRWDERTARLNQSLLRRHRTRATGEKLLQAVENSDAWLSAIQLLIGVQHSVTGGGSARHGRHCLAGLAPLHEGYNLLKSPGAELGHISRGSWWRRASLPLLVADELLTLKEVLHQVLKASATGNGILFSTEPGPPEKKATAHSLIDGASLGHPRVTMQQQCEANQGQLSVTHWLTRGKW
jgi:hypothetical protein